jgi:hypothetical protein
MRGNSLIINNKNDPAVTIFDLNNELEPKDIYDSIQCRKSIEVYVITTFCVHDLNRDKGISVSLMEHGIWELNILSNVFYVNSMLSN